jgi:hypothetical protein
MNRKYKKILTFQSEDSNPRFSVIFLPMIWIFMEGKGDKIKSKQASTRDRTLLQYFLTLSHLYLSQLWLQIIDKIELRRQFRWTGWHEWNKIHQNTKTVLTLIRESLCCFAVIFRSRRVKIEQAWYAALSASGCQFDDCVLQSGLLKFLQIWSAKW